MLKKLLKRSSKNNKLPNDASQQPGQPALQFEEAYDDAEAVHEYEQAQEDYLLSLALANSAKEYQRSSRPSRGAAQPSAALARAMALSRDFWQSGILGYEVLLLDGFYALTGDFPEVADPGQFPSLEALRRVQLFGQGDRREAVFINRARDERLRAAEEAAAVAAARASPQGESARVQAVAAVVADSMGGPCCSPDALDAAYAATAERIQRLTACPLIPLGALAVGRPTHRALLFKLLAGGLNIRCKVVRGPAPRAGGGAGDDVTAVVVEVRGSEWRLDLLAAPGRLTPATPGAAPSPLEPATRQAPPTVTGAGPPAYARGAPGGAQPAFAPPPLSSVHTEPLPDIFRGVAAPRGAAPPPPLPVHAGAPRSATPPRQHPRPTGRQHPHPAGPTPGAGAGPRSGVPSPFSAATAQHPTGVAVPRPAAAVPRPPADGVAIADDAALSFAQSSLMTQSSGLPSLTLTDDEAPPGSPGRGPSSGHQPPAPRAAGARPPPMQSQPSPLGAVAAPSATPSSPPAPPPPRTLPSQLRVSAHAGEWEVDPREIALGPRIGIGSYGEVYKGTWRGTEVAVKRFLEPHVTPALLQDFKGEVEIMARLRHPNIVLFMGAVTTEQQLAIVTQFMPRGSLFRLLHRAKPEIDGKRRLQMALDIARGMNYLHSCRPAIVHRDLKSPNLLVDRDWSVRVCDFGLSRVKSATFLTGKSHGGTPEWMAPEILRNEPSDEKADVYSFGVVLYELVSGHEPWSTHNAMQVVGAVGFAGQRLRLPPMVEPRCAALINSCWETNPGDRPSFAQILDELGTYKQLPVCELEVAGDGAGVDHRGTTAMPQLQEHWL